MSVARVGGRALFPARFQLVGTMNLCPCGGRGDPRRWVLVLSAEARGVPGQALPRAARPVRPRRSSCRGRGPRSLSAGPAEALRRRCGRGSATRVARLAGQPLRRTRGGGRAPRPRGRAPAAARAAAGPAWPGSRGPIAALAAADAVRPRARRRGLVVPRAAGAGRDRERRSPSARSRGGNHVSPACPLLPESVGNLPVPHTPPRS